MNNSARLACVLCLLGLVHSVPVPRFQHFMVKDNLWNRFDKNFVASSSEESDVVAPLLSFVNPEKINVDKKENVWVGSLTKSPETTNPNYPQKNSWTEELGLIDPEGGPAGRLASVDRHKIISTHTHTRPRKITPFTTTKKRMQNAAAKMKLANFGSYNKIAATGPDIHFRTTFPKRYSRTAATLPRVARKYSKYSRITTVTPKHSEDITSVTPNHSEDTTTAVTPNHSEDTTTAVTPNHSEDTTTAVTPNNSIDLSPATIPVPVAGSTLAGQELVKEQDRRMMSGFVSDDRESARLDNKERFRRRLELLLSAYPEDQRVLKRQQLVQQLLNLSSRLHDQINTRERDRRARIL